MKVLKTKQWKTDPNLKVQLIEDDDWYVVYVPVPHCLSCYKYDTGNEPPLMGFKKKKKKAKRYFNEISC